ncbi:RcnB family protein [Acinetobacter shaoyimingii]|uniref:RcnB family protein n=1 Tax=Acinetobacter shaoyimingii TaxID=2715164 RepID=A0A6G8RZN5_9GAMM|nr:RcnB family protein [Acinetobacter shaoyimingii]NHB59122.1 RcnB family protein [Acinetobacter shaoyimingii]QIO07325.1 RcnB family protein [Acinetobacter shaoyimingii]
MKKLLSAIAVSMGALMATSAMAAPYNHHDNRYQEQRHHQAKHWNNGKNDNRYNRYKTVNPSRDWRRGQVLPREYNSPRYMVNHKNYRHLTKPGRNQNWYKINGDFVLVDHRNGRIMSIVG